MKLREAVAELLDNRGTDYLHPDDREMLRKALDDRTGSIVHKRGGDYEFDGQIVGTITKKSGAIRYVVEDDRGLLLIMNGSQISGS